MKTTICFRKCIELHSQFERPFFGARSISSSRFFLRQGYLMQAQPTSSHRDAVHGEQKSVKPWSAFSLIRGPDSVSMQGCALVDKSGIDLVEGGRTGCHRGWAHVLAFDGVELADRWFRAHVLAFDGVEGANGNSRGWCSDDSSHEGSHSDNGRGGLHVEKREWLFSRKSS